jgi:hypothetical protein
MGKMTFQEWQAEAIRRFGIDVMKWKFVCPCCNHVQSVQDYKDAGAPETAVGFSCVGRWAGGRREAFGLFQEKGKVYDGPGPCNYAGGGLLQLNPVGVTGEDGKDHKTFAFAETGDE